MTATDLALERHAAIGAATAAGLEVEVLEQAVAIALDRETLDQGWHEWASCRPVAVQAMYPGRGARTDRLLARCREACAVQVECLAHALTNGEREGIWGGTSARGRRELRKALRSAGLLGVTGEEAYVAWQEPGAEREPAPVPDGRRVLAPWPHQERAVRAIVDEISAGGTCQVQMATASGKTHVALWAADALEVDRVLILVPSLSLIGQTAATWASDPRWADAEMLAVCSDSPGDLPATTDPADVRAFHQGPGRRVVLATYQSSPVLVDAGVSWGLVVADEAHHLAGDADKHFAAVVRGEIPADRTLYMTATPRRFTRRRSQDADVALVSMDDGGPFGRRVFTFTLGDAVDAGVVADYRVVVAAVDRATFERVAAHPELVDVDPHLLAGAIAVVEAMGDMRLGSCVSFHTRVERARSFARLVGQVAELLPGVRPPGPGWAGFVHGGASVRIRDRLLSRLADQQTWGVLANAKALGEGVDLPTLDAVAIVDPRNSETDVLQATGRALRLSGDKVGTVLLPVLLAGDADPDDPLSGLDPRSLDIVSGVLRALRAHDADLGARLDRTRRAMAKAGVRGGHRPDLGLMLRQRAARGLLRSRVELQLPGGALGDLAGAMALHLVREATASWEEAFGRLQVWVEEHGHARIPQSVDVKVLDGASTTLGQWVSRQRTLHRRGLLAAERVEALEALPGWMWNARDEAWWEKFDVFADFVAEHGRMPTQFEQHRGVPVGHFLWGCRAGYQEHEREWLKQFPDRVAALEALPGWSWSARDAWWEEHFEQLGRWAAEHGHAAPSGGTLVDGFDIGKWVAKERGKIRSGARTPDQVERLRSLPGWIDDFRAVSDALWDDGYRRLVAYVERGEEVRPGQLVPQSYVEPDGYKLGAWLLKQRQAHLHPERRGGSLTPERAALLEAIPGWSWTPQADQWQAKLDVLRRHARSFLGADGVLVVPVDRVDGHDLGSWATAQRMAYSRGKLEAERVAALEAVPGWSWAPGNGRRRAS